MTLQECYAQLEGDYDDARRRLMNEKLMQRFLIKFLDDPTMNALIKAVEEHDIDASFYAAHTLKGVSANLALTALQKSSAQLTDQLRSREHEADAELLAVVKEKYELAIAAIKQLM